MLRKLEIGQCYYATIRNKRLLIRITNICSNGLLSARSIDLESGKMDGFVCSLPKEYVDLESTPPVDRIRRETKRKLCAKVDAF